MFDENGCTLTNSELAKLLEAIDHAMVESAGEFGIRSGFEKARGLGEEVASLKSERTSREQFVFTLSHDLRSPLTSIKAAGELILKSAEDVNFSRVLAARVVEGALRLDQMIRDLLDANRIYAGQKLALSIEECDLVEIVRKCIEVLATIHGERFVLKSPEMLRGHWSKMDLRRVVENLADNAVKYGDPASPVTLGLEEVGERVRLSVHNEGEALSADEQASLFSQFERSKSAKAGGKQGWGIGLTLVRGVAEAHGGHVSVRCEPGKGTTFLVELPRDARRYSLPKPMADK